MNTKYVKTIASLALCLLASVLLISGCELIDASKVENPQIGIENILQNPVGGTGGVLSGLRRRLAVTIGIQSLIGDLVSDNLDNRTSFYDITLSVPRNVVPTTFTYPAAYEAMLQMNALADFGLSTVAPVDPATTNDQLAEIHFLKGMALLLLGENYRMFPIVENGPAVTNTQALTLAVTEFNTALPLIGAASVATQSMRANCYLALARAYRMLGDKTNAQASANSALAVTAFGTFLGGGTYVFSAAQDAANGPTSTLLSALVTRASNDIQPNPRLDFLDPKLIDNTIAMPVLKAEEAYFILAEIELSNGNLANARAQMTSAVNVALSRARLPFTDKDTRTSRPRSASNTVYSDSGRTYPAVANLVVPRQGATINVPTVSWTSQTAATIANLASVAVGSGILPNTQRFEHIRMLYLLRQEIFFGEGRRMCDLGIRLPVEQRQIDGNPNMAGTVAVQVLVPTYIPPNDEYRLFATVGTVVTMRWDMNKEIAKTTNTVNSVSPFGILP